MMNEQFESLIACTVNGIDTIQTHVDHQYEHGYDFAMIAIKENKNDISGVYLSLSNGKITMSTCSYDKKWLDIIDSTFAKEPIVKIDFVDKYKTAEVLNKEIKKLFNL